MPSLGPPETAITAREFARSGLPTCREFHRQIRKAIAGIPGIRYDVRGTMDYRTAAERRRYPYVRIASRQIRKHDRLLVIRAGIHGDEIAGPLTLMWHLGEVFAFAHSRGVKLAVFPLDNPSGFERHTRYNMEGDFGEVGNNDFLRYRLHDGTLVDDLGSTDRFRRWLWSSDPSLGLHLPKETRVLHRELKRLPLRRVRAVLDLHSDNFMVKAAAYHYGYGNTALYRSIVRKIEKRVKILRNTNVDSGYLNRASFKPEKIEQGAIAPENFVPKTDDYGCIVRHDGSLPDLMWRLGVQHCITVETTAETPIATADEVNLIWIRGLIDMIAAK